MNLQTQQLTLHQLYRKKMLGIHYIDETLKTNEPSTLSTTSLQSLHQQIEQCHLCELSKMRQRAFSYYGNSESDILVIDDYVMAAADQQKDITATKANALLQNMLNSVLGIPLAQTYYTHLLKCLPQDFNALHEPLSRCIDFLQTQISLLAPKLIISLGELPLQALLGKEYTYSKYRLTALKYGAASLIAIEHPNKIIRNPSYKKAAFQDLLFVKKHLEEME